MKYFQLTDALNGNDIIRFDGREEQEYIYGADRWQPTAVLLDYQWPDSGLYGQYRELDEAQAEAAIAGQLARLKLLEEQAADLAVQAHRDQRDKAGKPYTEHLHAVARAFDSLELRIVGWLHDLLEDTDCTAEQLLKRGFTERIVRAIEALTKREGESYDGYLARVKNDPISAAVKIADLRHNMDLSRLDAPTDADHVRADRYAKALKYLLTGRE